MQICFPSFDASPPRFAQHFHGGVLLSTSCATVSPGNSIRWTRPSNCEHRRSNADNRCFTSPKLLVMTLWGGIAQVYAQTPATWLHAQQHVFSYKTPAKMIWTRRCLYRDNYVSHKTNKTIRHVTHTSSTRLSVFSDISCTHTQMMILVTSGEWELSIILIPGLCDYALLCTTATTSMIGGSWTSSKRFMLSLSKGNDKL